MAETKRPRLTVPQQTLLDEIREAGTLYIRRYGQYGRTVTALMEKGYVAMTEPDYSSLEQNGYEVVDAE